MVSMTRRRTLAMLSALGMAATMRPIRAAGEEIIRLSIPGPQLLPFYPLELIPILGFDHEVGVRLAIRHLPSGVLATEDMLNGNTDFAAVGFAVLPNFLARKKEVRAFAVLSSGTPPYAILVRKALAKEIRSVKDLRGRSLGVPMGSASTRTYLHHVAEHWLKAEGVRPQEVRWTPITQNYEGAFGALAGEIVDAVFCEEPNSSTLIRQGLGVQIASLSDPRSAQQIPGSGHIRAVIVAQPQTLAQRPEAAAKMVKMLRRAMRWIHETPRDQIALRLGVADAAQRADINHALGRLPNFYSRDGRFIKGEIEATRQFMQEVGLAMPEGRTFETLIDDRWVR